MKFEIIFQKHKILDKLWFNYGVGEGIGVGIGWVCGLIRRWLLISALALALALA